MLKIQTAQYQLTLNRKAIEKNGIKLEDVLNRIQLYVAEGTKGSISINGNTFPVVIHTDVQNGATNDIFRSWAGDFLNKDGKKSSFNPACNPDFFRYTFDSGEGWPAVCCCDCQHHFQ